MDVAGSLAGSVSFITLKATRIKQLGAASFSKTFSDWKIYDLTARQPPFAIHPKILDLNPFVDARLTEPLSSACGVF